MGDGFWDALNTAPSSPSALPTGGAGANTFWDPPSSSTTQAAPGSDPSDQHLEGVEDSPGNPLSYAFGLVKNTVMDIPDVLKGLWAVGKATVGDALGAIGQATPGTFWGEEQVQKHGYAWGNIARATVGWGDRESVLLEDYKSRYGFNGLEEVKDQLYSNPLSYILDALAVAGGASVAAKTGAKLGMVSEGTATAIRGISPQAEALGRLTGAGRPVTPVVSLTSDVGKTPVEAFASTIKPVTQAGAVVPGIEGISTNVNWLKRAIQNTVINKALTRSTDDVKRLVESEQWNRLGVAPDNLGLQKQVRERLTMGAQEGLRVMRPIPEKFVANRAARYISGLAKQDFYGARNAMIQSLRTILDPEQTGAWKGKNWKLVKDIMGTNDYFEQQLRGMNVPPGGFAPSTSVDFEAGRGLYHFSDFDTPDVGVEPTARRQIAEAVQNYFNNTEEVAPISFTTPHSTDLGKSMRYTGLIGDMQDAPNVARDIAAKNGWELLGVRNYIGDASQPAWNGMHYFFRSQDGNVFEINIADQQLYDAQRIASVINDHINSQLGIKAGYDTETARQMATLEELGITPETASVEDAARLLELENVRKLSDVMAEELDAAVLWRNRIWDHPMRRFNSERDESGARRYGEQYGEHAEMVDQLFNWTTEWNLIPGMVKNWRKDWQKGIRRADGSLETIRGPFTTAINRAFMPQKLEAMHHILEFGREDIAKNIRENISGSGGLPPVLDTESLVLNIMELLEQNYHMPRKAIRDALLTPTDADVAKAMRAAAQEGDLPYSPAARRRIQEMAQDIDELDRPMAYPGRRSVGGEWRARGFSRETQTTLGDGSVKKDVVPVDIVKEPDLAAQIIIERLEREVRENILKGEIDGMSLSDWSWRTFAEASPQLPGYYPHIRAGSQGAMWWKGSTMKAPQMSFNKGFKGYLMDTGRVKADVFQAYSFRAYQILRHQELMDQFDALVPMARELTEGELMRVQQGAGSLDGEVLFSPEYAKKQLSLHAALLDDIHSGVIKDGLLYEDAARDALNGLNDVLQDITTDALAGAKVYALPKHVADQFKSGFLQGFAPGNIRMFWDKPRDLWISSVLGMNPRWFIYRAMGNIVFAGIHGGPDDILRLFGWGRPKNDRLIQMMLEDAKMPDGTSVLEHMSRGYTSAELQRLGFGTATPKPGRLGTPAQSKLREWGQSADDWPRLTNMADRIYRARISKLPRSIVARMTRRVNLMEQAERRGIALGEYAKAIGSRWESNINLARKIADEGIDEGLAAQLQTQANWVLGNYTMLSPLERDVVRRFLMPFYPFYRHMVKFSTRMPWDHPVKSQVLRLLHEVDEDMGPHLPGYMGGAVPIGSIGGIPAYWNTTHWNPLSELALPEGSPVMFLDPRLRTLYMAASGTDEFNQPYHADNVYTAPNGVEMIKTATGWQEFEGIQHEPWLDMVMSWYSGPGSQSLNLRGYNSPWWKEVAGQAGFTISQRDTLQDFIRSMEAEQAAFASETARETPLSWGQ